jgi:hypothetical protein
MVPLHPRFSTTPANPQRPFMFHPCIPERLSDSLTIQEHLSKTLLSLPKAHGRPHGRCTCRVQLWYANVAATFTLGDGGRGAVVQLSRNAWTPRKWSACRNTAIDEVDHFDNSILQSQSFSPSPAFS